MTIQENMKKIRTNKGYSMSFVAERMGITPQGYSYYENGKSEPTIENLKRIAIALDVDLSELLNIKSDRYYEYFEQFLVDLATLDDVLSEIGCTFKVEKDIVTVFYKGETITYNPEQLQNLWWDILDFTEFKLLQKLKYQNEVASKDENKIHWKSIIDVRENR
ncbi:MAG: helix-turn-helix domain-containing protein [Saccharofermentanales bacterium]|jgi:transcriptional regulator with XRE-family HTH domain|nr:helix-turn-helix transcriptional regulator [Candidatus Epulonipiscium sp.]